MSIKTVVRCKTVEDAFEYAECNYCKDKTPEFPAGTCFQYPGGWRNVRLADEYIVLCGGCQKHLLEMMGEAAP